MREILFCFFILVGRMVFAASGGHGGEHAVTLDEETLTKIFFQFINVAILSGGLFYFLRKPVAEFFVSKRAAYQDSAQKAQKVLKLAEQNRDDLRVKLTKLDSTADESLSRAQSDAREIKNKILLEALEASKRLEQEAEQTIRFEFQKPKDKSKSSPSMNLSALLRRCLKIR